MESNISDNCIVEEYRGYKIRKYPIIKLRITVSEMKKVIDAKIDFGFSVRDVIESKKILCTDCKQTSIISYKNTYAKGN